MFLVSLISAAICVAVFLLSSALKMKTRILLALAALLLPLAVFVGYLVAIGDPAPPGAITISPTGDNSEEAKL